MRRGHAAQKRPLTEDPAFASVAELAGTDPLELGRIFLQRVADLNPTLHAVLEVNPALEEEARVLAQGPLRGVPVLIKDNVDTAAPMHTTAGSLALAGVPVAEDAPVVRRLRAAGALVLGKANLSEWANFRGQGSISGWSAVGGQCRNPHVLDRSPCGSSSGSAAAVAAGLCTVAIGTETDGSIVCPSAMCGVVGVKPTVGLTSRAGVVPISPSQDTVGVHARSVADAAAVLTVIAERGLDYRRGLDKEALRGARIGIPRQALTGYNRHADRVLQEAIAVLEEAGALVVDPADLPSATRLRPSSAELTVLSYEFKGAIEKYLATRPGAPVRTLRDLVKFNEEHADEELRWFGQEVFEMSAARGPLTDPAYRQALEESHRLSRAEGIDAVLAEHRLDALLAPTSAPAAFIDAANGDFVAGGASQAPAMAGYPMVTVPAGWALNALPVGVSFISTAYTEARLLKLAYAFEQRTGAFRAPAFRPTLMPD